MRWVYTVENYPGRRSVRCKQGIGCWNMQTVWAWHWTCWLADLDTTVGGLVRCAACVCDIVFGMWERFIFLLGYANCGSLVLDVLAGRFKYYSWRSHKVCCMCLFGKWGAMYGVVCLGNVSGLGKCNSITGLGQ